MKFERPKVDFPLWRKKVDKSLLNVINAITYGSTFQLPPEIDPAFA